MGFTYWAKATNNFVRNGIARTAVAPMNRLSDSGVIIGARSLRKRLHGD